MFLYRILSILFFPLIAIYIFFRIFRKKENSARVLERFGFASIKKPQEKIIWIHAVSVGETNSALIMVDEILKNTTNIRILFTTTTITSASILASKINIYQDKLIHQFLPVDSYFVVKKFLKFWQPQKIIFVESEIWPNFIHEAKNLDIPIFLVNARISQKTFLRWKFVKKFGFKIFDKFNIIFAQTKNDQEKLEKLSDKKVLYYGNLKAQAVNLKFDENELKILQQQIGARKFWLAASTHKGEEEVIISIHKKLKEKFPDLLTIIVPRHPIRVSEILSLMSDTQVIQRSKKQKITDDVEIYLADTLGELGLFYKLSDFAFIGGSIANVGGHNPYEPIKLNCAIISGKNIFNFQEIYDELLAKKSCIIINDEKELLKIVDEFLSDNNKALGLQNMAFAEIVKNNDIVNKIIEQIF